MLIAFYHSKFSSVSHFADVNVDTITATSSTDFSISASSVTFPQNDASETITINVVDDSVEEDDETFTLTLADPLYTTGHKNLGDPYRITVTIQDNDGKTMYFNSA